MAFKIRSSSGRLRAAVPAPYNVLQGACCCRNILYRAAYCTLKYISNKHMREECIVMRNDGRESQVQRSYRQRALTQRSGAWMPDDSLVRCTLRRPPLYSTTPASLTMNEHSANAYLDNDGSLAAEGAPRFINAATNIKLTCRRAATPRFSAALASAP